VRILVVSSYPPRHCGIGTYARDQVARLRESGDEVEVLSPPDGAGDIREPFLGGRAFLRAAREGRRFDSIIVHFQPALYYRPRRAASKVGTSLALLWLALRRKQLDLLVHEADPPSLWRPDYAILRLALRHAGRVSFHTEAERAALERDYHVRVRGEVVPHLAVLAGTGLVTKEEARRRLGIEDGGPVLLCAGFLQPSKGFDRAVEAFEASGASKEGARLYVVGSIREPAPETEAYVRALEARCLAVPGATFCERFLSDEDFDLWIVAADAVVLPYRRAWSSAVLARAQALGTPAIASAVGGLAEQAGADDAVFTGDEELRRAFSGIRAGSSTPVASSPGSGDGARPVPRAKGRKVLIATILLSVALAALAQLTLKHGMNQVTHDGASPLDLGSPVSTLRRIAGSLPVWGGLAIFVTSAAVWLIVLSKVSLSFAYPFASLTYVLILVFDRFVLNQPVSGLRYAGVALIIAGILLVSRTHQTA
jgi:glycosyltransferase involved in cell wall biosynthesis/multidrug transporter EmrE-like cation transporter